MLDIINDNIKVLKRSVKGMNFEQNLDKKRLNKRLDRIEQTLEEVLKKIDANTETSKIEKGK